MSAPTFNVNGVGFKGGNVPSKEAGIVGFYHDGKPYRPDSDAIRALLPFRWRKAFDRAGVFWWNNSVPKQAYVVLRGRSGKYLTTIYANAVVLKDVA